MSAWAWWVRSPTDGTVHLLAVQAPGLLTAHCGRVLPAGALRHDRVPSGQLCQTCMAAYFMPEPVFSRTPAGHRCSDAPASDPGGQPVPAPVPWARCPVDERLHLLAPAQAVAAEISGHGRAACGRLIPAEGLTLAGGINSSGDMPRVPRRGPRNCPMSTQRARVENRIVLDGHADHCCVPRAGLTISGASVTGWCSRCLAVGTAR